MKRRSIIFAVAAVALTSLLAVAAMAATSGAINGTPKNDVLKGTLKADKINGGAGNDKLFGYAGNDTLIGGPGADTLDCGAGKDTAVYDLKDKAVKACEVLKGPKPTVSIAEVSAPEGNSGTTPFSFLVTLGARTPVPVTVNYATADGSATAGSDFQAASGKVTFAPGSTSATVTVSVIGDTALEPDETFTVALSGPTNAVLGVASATGTIKNDDVAATPGHYQGTTADNELWAFDIGSDGLSLSNLQTGQINESCSPPAYLSGGNFRLRGPYPVATDGSFTINATLTGTVGGAPYTGKVTITGKVSGGAASGTYREDDSFTYAGTPYSCTTGDQTWNATKQ